MKAIIKAVPKYLYVKTDLRNQMDFTPLKVIEKDGEYVILISKDFFGPRMDWLHSCELRALADKLDEFNKK